MTQLDPSRYKRLSKSMDYGVSDGLYWASTNSEVVVVIDDVVKAKIPLSQTAGLALVSDGTDFEQSASVSASDVVVGSDAAGDIHYKSGAATTARLAKGTAGQVLRQNAALTAPSWSDDLENVVVENFNALDTTDQVAPVLPSGLVATGATGVMAHLYTPGGKVFSIASLGAGQTLFPAIVASGLDIGGDQADDEGWAIWSNFAGASGRPFVVGKHPAFYFRCKLQIGNADGIDHLLVGFRRAGAHTALYTDMADYCGLGVSTAADPMAIKILTGLNGADTETDTTQTLAEGTAVQFEVLVSAAGVVTYRHDIVTPGTMAAPTVTAAFTLDDGDPVMPVVRFLNVAAANTNVIIHKWEAGFQ